jgi:hypothetical protein
VEQLRPNGFGIDKRPEGNCGQGTESGDGPGNESDDQRGQYDILTGQLACERGEQRCGRQNQQEPIGPPGVTE